MNTNERRKIPCRLEIWKVDGRDGRDIWHFKINHNKKGYLDLIKVNLWLTYQKHHIKHLIYLTTIRLLITKRNICTQIYLLIIFSYLEFKRDLVQRRNSFHFQSLKWQVKTWRDYRSVFYVIMRTAWWHRSCRIIYMWRFMYFQLSSLSASSLKSLKVQIEFIQ